MLLIRYVMREQVVRDESESAMCKKAGIGLSGGGCMGQDSV